jgi:hypothetical protein
MMNREELVEAIRECLENGQPLEASWLIFASKVLPDGVARGQFEDMRTSFFAGATCLFTEMCKRSLSNRGEPSKSDTAFMINVRDELKGFAREYSEDLEDYPVEGHA